MKARLYETCKVIAAMPAGTRIDWQSMLAAGEPVSWVAGRVGYDTPSAFLAAFRRETGQTRGALFKDRAFKDGVFTP